MQRTKKEANIESFRSKCLGFTVISGGASTGGIASIKVKGVKELWQK
ncbi:MAG: hypothetical protein R3Y24_13335 [Eubacteriales bacterium]